MTDAKPYVVEEWERIRRIVADERIDATVAALVAEVERLRGLVKSQEWGQYDDVGGSSCLWCGSSRRPHVDCPAFTSDGEVR